MKKQNVLVMVAGAVLALAALLLTKLGNPANMGFCIACFLRDTAGALGLHQADKVQYVRPETIGLVLGACIMALATREFGAKTGSAPFTRFVLGALVMVGALCFLGCPLRMALRIGGGDLNALVGLVGFAGGILLGILFIRRGFSLGRAYRTAKAEGLAFPIAALVLFVLACAVPGLFRSSEAGPGSMRAPVAAAFVVSLIVGALCQRARTCMAGGIRDAVMFRDFTLISGFGVLIAVAIVGNLLLGSFKLGFQSQPVAHSAHLWNLLGMLVVGWGSVLLGGCPLRQLILAGSGNADSAVTVIGMMAGAAFSHGFGLAGSADSVSQAGEYIVGGPSAAGKIAVAAAICILLIISLVHIRKEDA